jgi:adenylate cyclase
MTSPLQPIFPEERRWATVLFADVGGFTRLAERMEFESISDLIKEVWLRLDDIIWKYGGFIDKRLGDGVMAVWGAPYAGESDAERAVSAGLALLDSMKKFTQESQQPGARGLALRVGINTGPVLAGYVGAKDEYTVLGDTVNVAKRLEQMAESGRVLISESTYRLVRGDFKIQLLGPITLRGKTEPIRAYVVEQKREFATKVRYQSEEILHTRMVAREYELQRLTALYNQAVNFRKPTIVLLTGDAGIGKSRLLLEFSNLLEESEPNLTLMTTRALAQTSRDPFFMWKSLWQNRFGILDDEAPEMSREKFERGMQRIWGNSVDQDKITETTHLIGSFMGMSWPGSPYMAALDGRPEVKVSKVFELTKALFSHLGASSSIVLVFDDLQWADNLSLELVRFLVKPGSERIPLLIVAGTRKEFLREKLNWSNLGDRINLEPLPINAEIVRLAYPDLVDFPEEVMIELAKRSDGNPFFLEEMVKGLVKSGVAYSDSSPQEMITKLHVDTPGSLQAMLQARLDSLPRGARTIALMASVVGRVFWVGPVLAAARSASYTGTGLLKLRPPMIERVVQDGLRKLVQYELAFPRAGTHFSEDQEYIFKHSLLRDVTYSLIPEKYLPQYHLAVARWLVIRPDTKFKIMAADHFDQAGALREAARYYEYASREAETRGAKDEANWLLTKATEIQNRLDVQD